MKTWLEHIGELIVAHILAEIVIVVGLAALARFTVFAGRRSLRSRIVLGIIAISFIAVAAISVGANALVTLVAFAAVTVCLVLYVLMDISRVGIVNSFPTTSAGIKPVESLRLVKKSVDFLGIGAKKLTDSGEFGEMVERCQRAGGKIRLLLSTPKNPALTALATRNGRDPSSYASRVKESIGQALHVRTKYGADVVSIKLYELGSEDALPHFRLMFVDQEICILSHLLWNESEGMDNPQLIIGSNRAKGAEEESLYAAYKRYFDDLWNSAESSEITDAADERLSV
jgi:hypothetical protein